MILTLGDFEYLGQCLENFLFGLYSGIFAIYLQYRSARQGPEKGANILFYALWALYVLSLANVVADMAGFILGFNLLANLRIGYIQSTVNGCCDFLAQSILIYRCWIMWGCNIYVVIFPSLLAFAYLVTWLVSNSTQEILAGEITAPQWANSMIVAGIALSMAVNALVTGLIAWKIFKVYRTTEVKSALDDLTLSDTSRRKVRTVIFVVIESGMVLLSIQVARFVLALVSTDAGSDAFQMVISIQQMLNGITPTIILVRVSMGLSFHDEKSMVESAIGSLHFASDEPNSNLESEDDSPIPEGSSFDNTY